MHSPIDQLSDEIREVALQVNAAQDRIEERDVVLAAHQSVETVSQHYRELCASLSEGEKLKVERGLGRRLTDVRRLASLLPKVGSLIGSTPDRRVAGASEVGERRITGVSWSPAGRASAGAAMPAARPKYKVGGEVEGWCGPCAGLTDHHIVAMVGDDPKQVVCQACGSRHTYRTTPARKVDAAAPVEEFTSRAESQASRNAEKKAEELRALGREVAEAAEVRPFDARARYKTGEIIAHPTFGRGKVETVLRSSLLVRFANGGMKSLILS